MGLGRLKMDVKLNKFELDPSLSYKYLCDNLNDINSLSTILMEVLNVNSGQFFTFLLNDINPNQIYEFKYGGVAGGVRQKTLSLVYKILMNCPEIYAVFDECFASYNKQSKNPLFLDYGFHHENDVYYLMNKKNLSKENLKTCFHVSNAIWHSLCVLSKIKIDDGVRELSKEKIKEICLNAQLIILGAYDAESYVFWKRNDFMIDKLLDEYFTGVENLK